MIPTPPTISEMTATHNSRLRHQAASRGDGIGDFGEVADAEIIGIALAQAMTLSEQPRDLADNRLHVVAGFGTDPDVV